MVGALAENKTWYLRNTKQKC